VELCIEHTPEHTTLSDVTRTAALGEMSSSLASQIGATELAKLIVRRSNKNKGDKACKWVQLATVTPSGLPRARTVVLREVLHPTSSKGLLEHTWGISMITDARSTKMRDFSSQPVAELVWLLSRTSEQFRVLGQVTAVGPAGASDQAAGLDGAESTDVDEREGLQQLRLAAWARMKPGAQAQMRWPHPGLPKAADEQAARSQAGSSGGSSEHPYGSEEGTDVAAPQQAASSAPPDTFVFLLLRPAVIDHLELKTNRRWVYHLPSAKPLAEHTCMGGSAYEDVHLAEGGVPAVLQRCLTESQYLCTEVNA